MEPAWSPHLNSSNSSHLALNIMPGLSLRSPGTIAHSRVTFIVMDALSRAENLASER